MKKIITLSLLLVFFAACKTAAPTLGGDGSFDILNKETNGGREKAANIVIRSQEELNALYTELNISDVPTIDFTTSNVVALFMGQKKTGGYSIGIGKIILDGESNTATVQIIESEPEDMAMMMITTPYCIAKISKSKKVAFEQSPFIPAEN